MNNFNLYYNTWEKCQNEETFFHMVSEMARAMYNNENLSQETINIFPEVERKIYQQFAEFLKQFHNYVSTSKLHLLAEDLIATYKIQREQLCEEDYEDYENSLLSFAYYRHQTELAFKLLFEFVQSQKNENSYLLAKVRDFLNDVDDRIIFEREIVSDLKKIGEANDLFDPEFFWWLPNENYLPRLDEHITCYLEDRNSRFANYMKDDFELRRRVGELEKEMQIDDSEEEGSEVQQDIQVNQQLNEIESQILSKRQMFFDDLEFVDQDIMAAAGKNNNIDENHNYVWISMDQEYKLEVYCDNTISKKDPIEVNLLKYKVLPLKLCIQNKFFDVLKDSGGFYFQILKEDLTYNDMYLCLESDKITISPSF